MYLRPRSVFEKFIVAEKITRVDEIGRTVSQYKTTSEIIFGAISLTLPHEVEKWRGTKRDCDCCIVQRGGTAKAKAGDLLTNVAAKYLVQYVDELPGSWRIYYVRERADL